MNEEQQKLLTICIIDLQEALESDEPGDLTYAVAEALIKLREIQEEEDDEV